MAKKFGLGKGLEALIPNDNLEKNNNENSQKNFSINISINNIKANEKQPRKFFDNNKLMELAESLKEHGIIQPLIVKKEEKFYSIIAGERRWRAAKLAGLNEVPVIIMNLSDSNLLQISLIENIQREDLNPIEQALAYQKLLNDYKLTQEELSKKIGKSRTSITNTLRLLNLDYRVKEYIIQGIISEGHGRCLLPLEKEKQYELSQRIIDDSLSVRETEKIVKKIINEFKNKIQVERRKPLNPYYKEVRDRLQEYFSTKVNINSNKNKGKIEIEYYSEEDLQRILDIINM
ncbi:ParB/RepB/Spo0J family partition protein [Clostridium tarantellae]|uniref:ParB/RepB/Spo0J family partition protein n=1 Tax=Clostridium tarantellae TaxID=39493 RepID=A0A6I1MJS1_9CLOT|nr:ParB/RepB/Spo0J family partition protein [Clostridium tarantellae]MPQ43776.1 ParB/RepB/Spo0J family partition protein [Clostridium tarantellae]